MNHRLDEAERTYERLTSDLTRPEVLADSALLQAKLRERASLEPLVESYRRYRKLDRDVREHREFASGEDAELRVIAKAELPSILAAFATAQSELDELLLPKDPNDSRDVIIEIRSAAGGDEAALFAEQLLQMYGRYAVRHRLSAELLDSSPGNQGGLKDASLSVRGKGAYAALKFEGGVHRVQRVPATETQGRIHTSTATVVVLPEVEDAEVTIVDADIEMQVMRSTGAGGQSVNTTDSAVRLIHKPSGIVVKCQQEKSQQKNRAMAMKMLRAKLFDLEQTRIRGERDALRKGAVGSGDRSEKIRTYNFPQDRLTDHRIGYTRHALPQVMGGDLDDVVQALAVHFNTIAQNERQA